LKRSGIYDMIIGGNNRVTGCVDLIPNENGGDANEEQIQF